MMLAKGRSLKGCTCTIIGAVVGLSLVLPIFFTGTSLSEKILLDWLTWSKGADYSVDYGLDYSPSSRLRADVAVQHYGGGEPCLLKVFVYDWPRRFHLGMLKNTTLDQDLPWTDDETPPTWPQRSGLKKQHNVEYWMMVDLLDPRARPGERQVVRVKNGEHADLFFVPFFSSLSFNRYGHYMRDPDTEKDKKLQEEVANLILKSDYWKRSGGEDHIIPIHHPNAFRFYRNLFNSSIFIVADFGRNPPEVSSLRKDVVAPYTHVVPTYENDNEEDPFNSRKTLLFFQGRIKRKDDGVVRTQLANLMQNQTGVHFEDGTATAEGLEQATVGMRNSKFCLHPAGDTPSSCRLFDAIASHCVPVIISDKIELPYEDDLDYNTFALFFSVEESLQPGFLLGQLRSITQEQWLKLWLRLKQVAHHFEYQFPTRRDDAVNMIWRELHRKVPAVKLKVHRKQRLKIADWWTW